MEEEKMTKYKVQVILGTEFLLQLQKTNILTLRSNHLVRACSLPLSDASSMQQRHQCESYSVECYKLTTIWGN